MQTLLGILQASTLFMPMGNTLSLLVDGYHPELNRAFPPKPKPVDIQSA